MTRADLVAIGAHPDDVEIGAGGALALAAAGGLRAVVVDLTAGDRSTHGTAKEREVEARRAADILGIADRRCLGLPDSRVGTEVRHRDVVVDVLRELGPALVLAPAEADRHPDHAHAGRIVREAAYLAGLTSGDEAGRPHRPDRVLHFMLHDPFAPSLVLDVSGVWQTKMRAVRAHASQFELVEPQTEIGGAAFLDVIEARATTFGALVGVSRGEPFLLRGPVRVDGVAELFGPAAPAGSYRVYR